MRKFLWILLSFIGLFNISCKKNKTDTPTNIVLPTANLKIQGSKIYMNSNPVQFIGANAFHSFSAGGFDTKSWNLDIIREFIGNMKENPIVGGAIKDANGSYLYALQTLVDSNRSHHQITILCPFGWDGTSSSLFTGTDPSTSAWWKDYQNQIKSWAIQFKDQEDVWIEVYNEPYRYDRSDGYTDAQWTSDMNTMVGLIRNSGNPNIVLVPCAEQGQDESVLNNVGNNFLLGKTNILFDIHAYEKWLLVPNANMGQRIQALRKNQLPVFFGELGPINASVLMDPGPFLDSVYQNHLSLCAWSWKYSDTDQDALLNSKGTPNNFQNNNWGSIYQSLALKTRNP